MRHLTVKQLFEVLLRPSPASGREQTSQESDSSEQKKNQKHPDNQFERSLLLHIYPSVF